MIFDPDKTVQSIAGPVNLATMRRWSKGSLGARGVLPSDVFEVFRGCATFVKVRKLVLRKWLAREVEFVISRTYTLTLQKDEFVADMFDISRNHRIVAVSEPWDIYLKEDSDTNIDADMMDALVGRL